MHFSLPVYCYSDETDLDWGYRINAQLNPQQAIVAGFKVKISGKSFANQAEPVPDQWMVETVPIRLPTGTHKLAARALDTEVNVLTAQVTRIKSIRRTTRQTYLPIHDVTIDGRNNLIVNGKPVFPMGIYHVYSRDQMRQIREQGFNCIQIWGESLDHFKQQLDGAEAAGLMSWTVTKMVSDEYMAKLVTEYKEASGTPDVGSGGRTGDQEHHAWLGSGQGGHHSAHRSWTPDQD